MVCDVCKNLFLKFIVFLGFKEDSDGIKSLEGFWNYGMDQGVTIGCYKIDPDGEIGELAGVNVLFICTEETFADFFQMKVILINIIKYHIIFIN